MEENTVEVMRRKRPGEPDYRLVPRQGKRLSYVDAARHFAAHVTVRDDPPGMRPRDIVWLEGNNFFVEGIGNCVADEYRSSPGVYCWRIRVMTPLATVTRPPDRVPTFPDPGEDHDAERRGLAAKMLLVRRLLGELRDQIDVDLIGPKAYRLMESSGLVETLDRASDSVGTSLANMAAILTG
jgi:hypothetical protein